jgi:hypothetical protein
MMSLLYGFNSCQGSKACSTASLWIASSRCRALVSPVRARSSTLARRVGVVGLWSRQRLRCHALGLAMAVWKNRIESRNEHKYVFGVPIMLLADNRRALRFPVDGRPGHFVKHTISSACQSNTSSSARETACGQLARQHHLSRRGLALVAHLSRCWSHPFASNHAGLCAQSRPYRCKIVQKSRPMGPQAMADGRRAARQPCSRALR